MTDKKFRRLKRSDLIEIIYRLQENEEKLKQEIFELEETQKTGTSGTPEIDTETAAQSLQETPTEEHQNTETPAAKTTQATPETPENTGEKTETPAGKKTTQATPETPETPENTGEKTETPAGKKTKKSKKEKTIEIPGFETVKNERNRLQYKRRYRQVLTSTVAVLVVVAAVSVLIATLFFTVLQVSGASMEPTLEDQDVLVLLKSSSFEVGDLVAIRYEGRVLLKRVIGSPGDYIDIDEDGNVYINGELLDEPYVSEKALGECDITLPYQVPDNSWFVMGDHRSVSLDSRSTKVGCIRKEQIIGRALLRILPFKSFGTL